MKRFPLLCRHCRPAWTTRICRGRYDDVRNTTTRLARPLAIEDYVIQSSPDCSPS
jgi:hypothetical protein